MSTILIVHKVEPSEGDRPSKYEQTHKLMLDVYNLVYLHIPLFSLNPLSANPAK